MLQIYRIIISSSNSTLQNSISSDFESIASIYYKTRCRTGNEWTTGNRFARWMWFHFLLCKANGTRYSIYIFYGEVLYLLVLTVYVQTESSNRTNHLRCNARLSDTLFPLYMLSARDRSQWSRSIHYICSLGAHNSCGFQIAIISRAEQKECA